MTELSAWLRAEPGNYNLSQHELAACVGVAASSDTRDKDHIPKLETLFRLADYFHTSREQVLRIAGHLPRAPADPRDPAVAREASDHDPDPLTRQLLLEYRCLPDEWKPAAVEYLAHLRPPPTKPTPPEATNDRTNTRPPPTRGAGRENKPSNAIPHHRPLQED
jgi:transcriptional regulator with XRE-family HTH domain